METNVTFTRRHRGADSLPGGAKKWPGIEMVTLARVTPLPELLSACSPGHLWRLALPRASDPFSSWEPLILSIWGKSDSSYGTRYREMQGWQRLQHIKTNGPFRQGHTEAATQLPWWSPCISSTVGTLDQFSPVWEQSGDSGRHALSHGGIAVSGKLFALFILS